MEEEISVGQIKKYEKFIRNMTDFMVGLQEEINDILDREDFTPRTTPKIRKPVVLEEENVDHKYIVKFNGGKVKTITKSEYVNHWGRPYFEYNLFQRLRNEGLLNEWKDHLTEENIEINQ